MMKEKYINYLKYELNYSEKTIETYLGHIDKFFEYLKKNKIDFKIINKDQIIDYLKFLDSEKLSNKTISNILSSLRNLYNFLLDEKIIQSNIFKSIKNPKIEKRLPNFLSYEEMREIIDSIETKNFAGYRNKLIIELLYSTGIRLSELVNLKRNNINFSENSIRILGKGNKERIVYYGSYAKKALKEYLNICPENEFLILNSNFNKISSRGVQKIVDKVVMHANINHKVSPHTFRHTFATHLLNNGADVKSVQELLGHSSLNTTEIYTHITSDYLKSEYLKHMPRR